jgi:hypothetical protein
VLDTGKASAAGIVMRPWREALADESPTYAAAGTSSVSAT